MYFLVLKIKWKSLKTLDIMYFYVYFYTYAAKAEKIFGKVLKMAPNRP